MKNIDKRKQINHNIFLFIMIVIIINIFVLFFGMYRSDKLQVSKNMSVERGLPSQMVKHPKISNAHYYPTTFPTSLRGTYIDDCPVQNSQINKHYHVISIVRIAPHDIYQQFVLNKRHIKLTNIRKRVVVRKNIKHLNALGQIVVKHKKAMIIHHYRPSTISTPTISGFSNLQSKIQYYNIDMQPGNMHQHGNDFTFKLKQQTMVGGYNYNRLSQLIGTSSAIALPPAFYNTINIYADKNSNNIAINDKQFKRISNKRVKGILNQADVHSYFIGL